MVTFAFVPLGGWSLDKPVLYPLAGVHLLLLARAVFLGVITILRMARGSGALGAAGVCAASAILAAAGVMAALPITSRDALLYHLAVPRIWVQNGHMVEVPWHEWSYFPMQLGLAYSLFIEMGADWCAPYYHFAYYALAGIGCAIFAGYWLSNKALGILAGIVVLGTPLALRFGIEPIADFALVLYFSTAVFLWLLKCEDQTSKPNASGPDVFWIGAALGVSLGTKYSAIPAAAIFCVLAVLYGWWVSRSILRPLWHVAVCAALAALSFGPWMIRNFMWTENPFYPFLSGYFGNLRPTPFVGELSPVEYRMLTRHESPLDILLLPLRMLYSGVDNSPQYFDGVLTPLLGLAVIPVAACCFKRFREPWVLFLAGIAGCYFIVAVLLFHALVRYQLVVLPIVALLSVAALRLLTKLPSQRYVQIAGWLLLLLQTGFSGEYLAKRYREFDVIPYVRGQLTKAEFMTRQVSEYPLADYVNRFLPPATRVYLLYSGNRFYLYDRLVVGGYFSAEPIIESLQKSTAAGLDVEQSADALADWMRRSQFTHLAIHNLRTRQVFVESKQLSSAEQAAWERFVEKYMREVKAFRTMSLWRFLG